VDSNHSVSDCDDEEVEQEPSQTSNEWVGTLVQYAAAHGVADEFRALFDDSFVNEPSAISGYEYVEKSKGALNNYTCLAVLIVAYNFRAWHS
jgi:hypothetical protein